MLTRRDILKSLGISPTALPFLSNLSSVAADANGAQETKRRLVIVFTPDGVVKENFWPISQGSFSTDSPITQHNALPSILTPFEFLKDQLLLVKGVDNQIRGDGDGHMLLPAGQVGSLLTRKLPNTCKKTTQRQHGFVHSSLVYSFPTRLTHGREWSMRDQISHSHQLTIHTRCSKNFMARPRTEKA